MKFAILCWLAFFGSSQAVQYSCYYRTYYARTCHHFTFSGECHPWALDKCKPTRVTTSDYYCRRYFCDVVEEASQPPPETWPNGSPSDPETLLSQTTPGTTPSSSSPTGPTPSSPSPSAQIHLPTPQPLLQSKNVTRMDKVSLNVNVRNVRKDEPLPQKTVNMTKNSSTSSALIPSSNLTETNLPNVKGINVKSSNPGNLKEQPKKDPSTSVSRKKLALVPMKKGASKESSTNAAKSSKSFSDTRTPMSSSLSHSPFHIVPQKSIENTSLKEGQSMAMMRTTNLTMNQTTPLKQSSMAPEETAQQLSSGAFSNDTGSNSSAVPATLSTQWSNSSMTSEDLDGESSVRIPTKISDGLEPLPEPIQPRFEDLDSKPESTSSGTAPSQLVHNSAFLTDSSSDGRLVGSLSSETLARTPTTSSAQRTNSSETENFDGDFLQAQQSDTDGPQLLESKRSDSTQVESFSKGLQAFLQRSGHRNSRQSQERDCGHSICFEEVRFEANCVMHVDKSDTEPCDYPCTLRNCATELHYFSQCPVWTCSEKTTTVAPDPNSTTTTPDPSSTTSQPPKPNDAPICASFVCISSVTVNCLIFLVAAIVASVLLRKRFNRRNAATSFNNQLYDAFEGDSDSFVNQGPIVRFSTGRNISEQLPLLGRYEPSLSNERQSTLSHQAQSLHAASHDSATCSIIMKPSAPVYQETTF